MKTAILPYGKYSMGSGSILPNPDRLFSAVDDEEIINAYESSIRSDLDKACIPSVMGWDVLDVGTGRQAIALMNLGAKRIRHYDLSVVNINRMQSYIETNSLQDRISTECGDIVDYALPEESSDLVYLNGIVQHFSDVGKGLINCMQAVKKDGYLWLYFYRSGTLEHFLIYMIRDFIEETKNIYEYYANAVTLFSSRYFISNIMCNFFDLHINLFTPGQYLSFIEKCGFEVVASSGLTNPERTVDHDAHCSVVLTCKRVTVKDMKCDILSPEKSIDQLDISMYEDKDIIETIQTYQHLRQAAGRVPRSVIMSMAFRMYRFLENNEGGVAEFQELLKAMIKTIEEEFANVAK